MEKEQLYKKVGDEYVKVPLRDTFNLPDGIWLLQSENGVKSCDSLIWKLGNPDRIIDIASEASVFTVADDICKYISKLSDTTSEEWIELKKLMGNWINGAIGVYNISINDFVIIVLRKFAENLKNQKDLPADILWKNFIKKQDRLVLNNPVIKDFIEKFNTEILKNKYSD